MSSVRKAHHAGRPIDFRPPRTCMICRVRARWAALESRRLPCEPSTPGGCRMVCHPPRAQEVLEAQVVMRRRLRRGNQVGGRDPGMVFSSRGCPCGLVGSWRASCCFSPYRARIPAAASTAIVAAAVVAATKPPGAPNVSTAQPEAAAAPAAPAAPHGVQPGERLGQDGPVDGRFSQQREEHQDGRDCRAGQHHHEPEPER